MSNSSDTRSGATRLLNAISGECVRLSEDIEQLGSHLSGEGRKGDHIWIAALQHFDRLSQHARAQSRLLAHLLRMMDEDAPEQALRLAIAEVPLPEARHRLEIALGLPERAVLAEVEEPEFWPDGLGDAESAA